MFAYSSPPVCATEKFDAYQTIIGSDSVYWTEMLLYWKLCVFKGIMDRKFSFYCFWMLRRIDINDSLIADQLLINVSEVPVIYDSNYDWNTNVSGALDKLNRIFAVVHSVYLYWLKYHICSQQHLGLYKTVKSSCRLSLLITLS
jgi:hypothetical protein